MIDREKPGRSPKLSEAQRTGIKELVLDKSPEDCGYNSSTWTGLLLMDWIKNNYGIEYKKAQVYNILKSLGLTFQKGKGVYPEAIEREEKLGALKKLQRERENKSVVVFQDEASLSNTASVSHKWGEKGKQPRIEQKQRKRERRTLFGCVEPITAKVITAVQDKGNTATFFKFLVKVSRQYPGQKVVMVVDNVRYHHAKRLRPILEKYKDKLELAYLPAYSPDLNPIERIWWYMRKKISHNRYLETMNKRIEKFNELMKTFEPENELGKKLSKLIVNI